MNNDVSERAVSQHKSNDSFGAEFFFSFFLSGGELFPLDFLPPLIFPVEQRESTTATSTTYLIRRSTRGGRVYICQCAALDLAI